MLRILLLEHFAAHLALLLERFAALLQDDSIGVADWSYDEHMTGKYAVPTANGTGYEVQKRRISCLFCDVI